MTTAEERLERHRRSYVNEEPLFSSCEFSQNHHRFRVEILPTIAHFLVRDGCDWMLLEKTERRSDAGRFPMGHLSPMFRDALASSLEFQRKSAAGEPIGTPMTDDDLPPFEERMKAALAKVRRRPRREVVKVRDDGGSW